MERLINNTDYKLVRDHFKSIGFCEDTNYTIKKLLLEDNASDWIPGIEKYRGYWVTYKPQKKHKTGFNRHDSFDDAVTAVSELSQQIR